MLSFAVCVVVFCLAVQTNTGSFEGDSVVMFAPSAVRAEKCQQVQMGAFCTGWGQLHKAGTAVVYVQCQQGRVGCGKE